jgi:hypothetical protein
MSINIRKSFGMMDNQEAVDSLLLLCQAIPLIENNKSNEIINQENKSESGMQQISSRNNNIKKINALKNNKVGEINNKGKPMHDIFSKPKNEMTEIHPPSSSSSSSNSLANSKQLNPLTENLISNIELEIININDRNSLKIKKHELTYDCQFIFPGECFTDIYCGKYYIILYYIHSSIQMLLIQLIICLNHYLFHKLLP